MIKKLSLALAAFGLSSSLMAQLPKPALVGYWESWNGMKLSAIHENYNVIQIAFATTKGSSLYDMTFALPYGYTKTQFLTDIDNLHAQGKVVILSIGGATDPVRLDNQTAVDGFVNSINTILSTYNYKIDGIDLDLESTSMAFGTWTMASPAAGQTNMINAVKSIMTNYYTQTGKKLLLTAAPETVYVQGGMSQWQVTNSNGGAFLPILEGLKTELDMLNVQLYNAGGTQGGSVAIDGKTYYDDGTADYITAMTESTIKGFTIKGNKGSFSGVDQSKVGIGLPASYDACNSSVGVSSGYVTPAVACEATKYLLGKISKPSNYKYVVTKSYPNLAGLMTWSIDVDKVMCNGAWSFAQNFTCAFPKTVTGIEEKQTLQIITYPNPTNDMITIENLSELGSNQVEIYSIQGNLEKTINLESSDNQINIQDLNSGFHILKIGNYSQKIEKI